MPADPISSAILGGVGVFANLWGASKAAKAAKEAAKLQVDATKRAQGSADQVYADQRTLMDPYVRMGQLSLADLQAKRFGGTREQYLPTQAPPTSGPGNGPPLSGNARAIADAYQQQLGRPASLAEIQDRLADPNFDILNHTNLHGTPEARAFAARGGNQAPAMGSPVSFPAPAPARGGMPAGAPPMLPTSLAAMQQQHAPQGVQMPQTGGMVKLQGPDGSVRDVPEALAQQFIAKGARRVA